ncbi:MAG: hypothetical protein R6U19_05340 [Bacteroidales bacterium]
MIKLHATILFLFFFSLIAPAQSGSKDQDTEKETQKFKVHGHEFNTGVMNLFGVKSIVQGTAGISTKSTNIGKIRGYDPPGFALGYKYHINGSALRAGFGYAYHHAESEEEEPKLIESYSGTSFYLGYHYELQFPRTALYFGVDGLYETQFIEKITENIPDEFYESETIDDNAYGARPFIGIRFFVTEHFSLSTESYFYMRWFTLKDKKVDGDGEELRNKEFYGNNMHFGPLGTISINFHL